MSTRESKGRPSTPLFRNISLAKFNRNNNIIHARSSAKLCLLSLTGVPPSSRISIVSSYLTLAKTWCCAVARAPLFYFYTEHPETPTCTPMPRTRRRLASTASGSKLLLARSTRAKADARPAPSFSQIVDTAQEPRPHALSLTSATVSRSVPHVRAENSASICRAPSSRPRLKHSWQRRYPWWCLDAHSSQPYGAPGAMHYEQMLPLSETLQVSKRRL